MLPKGIIFVNFWSISSKTLRKFSKSEKCRMYYKAEIMISITEFPLIALVMLKKIIWNSLVS